MAGLAGAALALELGIFQQNLTNGHGFIAIALVYFGAWRPLGVMAGSMVFGLVSAMVLQWKTLGIVVGTTASIVGMFPGGADHPGAGSGLPAVPARPRRSPVRSSGGH